SVGLCAYLLQGGQGWNSRSWGWACENVVGVDAVTADGRRVHADADEHADLYWAARRARLPGPGHPVLPAHPSAAAGHDAGHLDVPGAGGGTAAGLAARDPARA